MCRPGAGGANPLQKFLFELVEGEETKPVGPCGTCGAIRVGAVSALFAPNGGRRWREHRGLRPVRVGGLVSAGRVSACESGRAGRRGAAGGCEEQTAPLLIV